LHDGWRRLGSSFLACALLAMEVPAPKKERERESESERERETAKER
jgi:hypothetical protein